VEEDTEKEESIPEMSFYMGRRSWERNLLRRETLGRNP